MNHPTFDLVLQHAFSRHEVEGVSAEWFLNHHLDAMVVKLKKSIETEVFRREETESVSVPADWWSHVKRDLLPRWIARRLSPPKLKRIPVLVKLTLIPRR
jgi:hypothetical protein